MLNSKKNKKSIEIIGEKGCFNSIEEMRREIGIIIIPLK